MELIVITLILAFIATCFEFIVSRTFSKPDVENKVNWFFLKWWVWAVVLTTFGAFACKLL